mmetsp:Transcript_9819/g.17683  ORF Transcript_9819/g.17683 Transcript_9819/m.17683 type:complete len:129 (-) Transcript_9819:255-641(-)|eukprot:CAMPEP_0201867214 /NCGR_PEP_ID=MMETSP0902-20130614/1531_1 /ASSEMBLY_ACC=CAM_ASM_000551 /TAXON_ID=420261 /ORGANISM="Thalassiosira antarctica, Strain CCMP982" /LENGTH=128 /DNA_ID=CAMNT_0048392339 /DNA_START=544 /DNA_END=930 /DNA_ORIENTATION=-
MTKGILRLIIRGANRLLATNGIHNARRASDVQQLHDRVVKAIVGREEVEVAGEEDEQKEFVGAEGDAGGVFGEAETEEEDEDGEDVGHVPAEAEEVHGHFEGVFLNVAVGVFDFFSNGDALSVVSSEY